MIFFKLLSVSSKDSFRNKSKIKIAETPEKEPESCAC
jgi:hypothetical protein